MSEMQESIEDVVENHAPSETPSETVVETGPPVEAPPFAPDFKFKVMDKEHEIDELFQPIAKDEESYKKVKELFEKSYGLDVVKNKHQLLNQKVQSEYEPVVKKYQQIEQNFQVLDKMLEKKDYDNFFSQMGLKEDDVLKWAANKARLMQLTPSDQALYNEKVQSQAQNYTLEQRMAQFERQQYQTSVQQRQMELDTEVSRPEISSQEAAFDSRVGKPGAFKEFVVQQALYAHQFEGKDLSAKEAVERSLKLVGTEIPQAQNQSTQGSVAAQSRVVTPRTTPTIPNLKGGSTSPVKKGFKSLDEIKKFAKQLESQGS